MAEQKAIVFRLGGRVQGVGFRYFTRQLADRLGIVGWVRNCADGSVEGEAQGSSEAIADFEAGLRQGPSHGRVERLESQPRERDPGWSGFEIRY